MSDAVTSKSSADEDPTIEVDADLAARAQTLLSASLQLVVATGTVNGEPVLVPYVECEFDNQIKDADGKETTVQIRSLLSIDNLAYLLDEVSGEFDRIMPFLASMAKGELRIPGGLLGFSIERLAKAEENLASVRRQLALLEVTHAPPAEAAAEG